MLYQPWPLYQNNYFSNELVSSITLLLQAGIECQLFDLRSATHHTGLQQWWEFGSRPEEHLDTLTQPQSTTEKLLEISESCLCSVLWGVTAEATQHYSVAWYVPPRISTPKGNHCFGNQPLSPTRNTSYHPPTHTPRKICAKVKKGFATCEQYTYFITHSRWIKMRSLYDFWV